MSMKNNQNQDPVQITIDKKNNKSPVNNIIPQSTKHSGHSKIKGFSFQIETMTKEKPVEENSKERFQILDEDSSKNSKYHKNKISLSSVPSQLLTNKDGKTNPEEKNQEESQKKNDNTNLNGNPKVSLDTPLHITDLIKDQNYVPITKDVLKKAFEKYESARHSAKSLAIVKSFAANTHQGTVRKYNEDRVSIILNIVKPNTYKGTYWPSCSFFAVFDGHGGPKCADFLKDNLHNYVSFKIIFYFKLIFLILDCKKPLFSEKSRKSYNGRI
jgi:hypothetical protein